MSLLQAGFGSSADAYEITDSLRLRSSASAYLSRTPSSGNQQTWTLSFWCKIGSSNWIADANTGGLRTGIYFTTDQLFFMNFNGSGYDYQVKTTQLFRDHSAWYHIVIVFNSTDATSSDRIKIYVNGERVTSFETAVYPSLNFSGRWNSAIAHTIGSTTSGTGNFDGYLTEINHIDGQALTADDFGEYDANGTWKPLAYTGTYGTNGFYLPMKPTTQADGFNTVLYTGTGASQSIDGVGFSPDLVWTKSRSNAQNHELYDSVRGPQKYLLPDLSTAEGTAAGGLFSFDTDGFSVGNSSGSAVNISGQSLVAWTWDAGDNQPSTGHSSIIWKGNGNVGTREFSGFGFSPDLILLKGRSYAGSPQIYDSVRGGLNKLFTNGTSAESSTNTYGLLSSFTDDGFIATQGSSDFQEINNAGSTFVAWGWDAGDGDPVSNTTGDINSTVKASDATGFSIVSYTGNGTSNSEQTIGHGLSTAPKVVIVKNRTSGTRWHFYSTDLSSDATYAVKNLLLNSSNAESAYSSQIRGIQGSNTFSVRDVDANGNAMVNKSGDNYIAYCFSEVSGVSSFGTYTGNGSTTGPTITTGFRPGFVMIKSSTQAGTDWLILDSTRSPFNTIDEVLRANLSNAEVGTGYGDMDVSDTGFQIKTNGASSNTNGQTYIYMAFKGSYSDYVSPLNDTGTIDSRVKANDAYGFSIASYVGTGSNATIAHGLSAAPDLAIFKNRNDGNDDWWTYNSISGATKFLRLNTTAALGTSSVTFNDTEPTSTVFTIGTGSAINTNGDNHIAYFFRSVTGHSKIGSYTGTGTTTGNVTTTGFRPAFLMVKGTSITSEWVILDNTRDPNPDPAKNVLIPNRTNVDSTAAAGLYVKFTDTGFQPVGNGTDTNSSGQTYIYMAIADTRDAVFNFDASGNKNNWLPNNINSNAESETTYDLMKDTPSLVDENAGNFAVINPLVGPSADTISEANLKIATSLSYAAFSHTRATIGVSSGKWYWEVEWDAKSATSAESCIGITTDVLNPYSQCIGQGAANVSYGYRNDAYKFSGGSISSYGATYTVGDVIGVALDLDAGTLAFYKNGVAQGTAYSSISGTYFPGISDVDNNTSRNSTFIANFGQRPFKYTPPTGFLKLNTFNLPDSTIEKGSDHMTPLLYSGTSSTQSITGADFQPDLTITKDRNHVTHVTAVDAVRGAPLDLFISALTADSNDHNGITAFTANGFNLGSSTNHNVTGHSYATFNWKANGSGSSNTDGSITSTVSANPTAGFSIVGFTAPSGTGNFTAGHGLGVTPGMVFVKTRESTSAPWYTWHNTFSNLTDDYMRLNSTSAKQTQSSGWGAGMTSSVIGLKAGSTTVATENHIAYCFAEVEGYSSIGSYTGNGSTDGPFVYTGFRPAWILVKVATGQTNATSWNVFDTTRNTFNVIPTYLFLDSAGVESDSASTYFNTDILSNGFKIRAGNTYGINQSGATYIYMAFAENPFKNANAR